MLTNKKENGLLYAGAGIFLCTSIIYGVLRYYYPDLMESATTARFGEMDNVILLIFIGLTIAPIFEELVFRGIFTQKRIFTVFFYLGSIALCIANKQYYLIVLPIIFLCFQLLKVKQQPIFYVLNALLFALIHYNIRAFENVYSMIPILFQLSLGLILIWVTLNYGLKRSIMLHFMVNFFPIGFTFFALQFPADESKKMLQIGANKFEWQRTPVIGSTKLYYTTSKVTGEKKTVREFINSFPKDSLTNLTVDDSLLFDKFNFMLENVSKRPITSKELRAILLKSELVREKKG